MMSTFQELNLNNYGPDDVERLNQWAIDAHSELIALRKELEDAKKDAARYRWIKAHPFGTVDRFQGKYRTSGLDYFSKWLDSYDAAIDEAMENVK